MPLLQDSIAEPFKGLRSLLVLVLVLVLVKQMLRHRKSSSRYTTLPTQVPLASKQRREIRERQTPETTQRIQDVFDG